jgi:hypothetical protein
VRVSDIPQAMDNAQCDIGTFNENHYKDVDAGGMPQRGRSRGQQ